MKNQIRICFTVFGLAVDEIGEKADAGVCITLGETVDEEVNYEELTKNINKANLLKFCHLENWFTPEDVTIITPEEYDRDFGVDDELEDELVGDA